MLLHKPRKQRSHHPGSLPLVTPSSVTVTKRTLDLLGRRHPRSSGHLPSASGPSLTRAGALGALPGVPTGKSAGIRNSGPVRGLATVGNRDAVRRASGQVRATLGSHQPPSGPLRQAPKRAPRTLTCTLPGLQSDSPRRHWCHSKERRPPSAESSIKIAPPFLLPQLRRSNAHAPLAQCQTVVCHAAVVCVQGLRE